MTPQREQQLRLDVGLGATIAGGIAMAVTRRDPAAGQTVAIALADITGRHWDHYKAIYQGLKGGIGDAPDSGPELTKEIVDAILARIAPEVPPQ